MAVRLFLVISVFILAGCSVEPRSFQYSPPEGEEALACTEQCKFATEACLEKQQHIYEKCLRHDVFRRDKRHENDCVRGLGSTQVGTCASKRLCPAPDSHGCRLTYNECYTACGGVVELVE